MKIPIILFMLAGFLAACGTRPPAPPDCEGTLTPINVSSGVSESGAVHAPERRP
ncbi:hypothetical protein [Variovorax boronicumulans]|uniref:hypothetical protein n=1 Tax=Variovorax boronicumulans TaxID=436515 RepID=UPI0027842992|nr:hypothetical protein [Variovorax boronicumulans]MDQ0044315.1 hypothetical protein [Variovorax boronicumulans]